MSLHIHRVFYSSGIFIASVWSSWRFDYPVCWLVVLSLQVSDWRVLNAVRCAIDFSRWLSLFLLRSHVLISSSCECVTNISVLSNAIQSRFRFCYGFQYLILLCKRYKSAYQELMCCSTTQCTQTNTDILNLQTKHITLYSHSVYVCKFVRTLSSIERIAFHTRARARALRARLRKHKCN